MEDGFLANGDIGVINLLLRNAETISLNPEATDALLLLSDPNADPDLHEAALAVATEGFTEIC